MATQELWRFENGEGYGPYNSGPDDGESLRCRLQEAHDTWNSAQHTIAHNWSNRKVLAELLGVDEVEMEDTKAGCPSYESLLKWFDGWVDEIREAGFQVVWYEYLEEHVLQIEDGLPQLVAVRPGAEGEGLDEFGPLKREVVDFSAGAANAQSCAATEVSNETLGG